MRFCNCTVMLTNPDCWKTCSNMNEAHTGDHYPYDTNPLPNIWTTGPQKVNVKKTIKTIEKYDANGEYIGKEVVTEETFDEVHAPYIASPTIQPYIISTDSNGTQSYTFTVGAAPYTNAQNLNDCNLNECCR